MKLEALFGPKRRNAIKIPGGVRSNRAARKYCHSTKQSRLYRLDLLLSNAFCQEEAVPRVQILVNADLCCLDSFEIMGDVFLDKTISLLSSDKQRTRSEGLADLKHILQRNTGSKL